MHVKKLTLAVSNIRSAIPTGPLMNGMFSVSYVIEGLECNREMFKGIVAFRYARARKL
ncbi:hypothetical protein PHLCEN_2v4216 [Hermanssonia centrifuga]|uniref:Uncharacterized protein n=1 Tax=Hermanssonia centrifuga TaxID=98765 RepID=A0A2R6PZ21_9APHY|nr:hypothetical protein PHLCEN_2v4216 [Hermanssonia centrifuga]